MTGKRWIILGLVLLSPVIALRGIGCASDIRKGLRSPEEELAIHNAVQLEMLAKHRDLFEGAAKGDPQSIQGLKSLRGIRFVKSGSYFRFEWWHEAPGPFSCMNVLFYCPNGKLDLGITATNRHFLMRIEDHWFAAKENCG